MGRQITCDNCGTIFKFEVVKGAISCPVCGQNWEDETTSDIIDENMDEDVMYFDEIVIFKDEPKYNHVSIFCNECKKDNSLDLDMFTEIRDRKYVILKDGKTITCRGCEKIHKNKKILYKERAQTQTLPHCPYCNSIKLKKIKTSSKLLAAASVGVFALPYTSKTYECLNCGCKF